MVAILIYAILVPLMVFFMLKDKQVLMGSLRRFLLAQLTALDALRYAAPAPHAASPLRQAQSLVKQLRQRIGAYRRARPAPSSAR